MYRKDKFRLLALTITISAVITFGFIIHTIQNLTARQIELSNKIIREQAIALFDTIVTFRYWSAIHGGVYVKKTPGMEPNPYLKNNTIKSDRGETLLLVNPAWMTRQIFELFQQREHDTHYYKITSPNPINPHNAPDEFEKEAFEFFKKNGKEKYYFKFPEDSPDKLYFMGLLKAEKPCLQCHENIKIGDIRGGIRITIPVATFRAKESFMRMQSAQLVIMISILVILTGLLAAGLFIAIERSRKEIQIANASLEETVKIRTENISILHQNENRLRKIIQTHALVNKEIINITSLEDLLLKSCNLISAYDHFAECWYIVRKQENFEIQNHSDAADGLFNIVNSAGISGDLNQLNWIFASFEEKNIKVSHELQSEATPPSWRKVFLEHGIKTAGAIPVAGKSSDTPYGLLLVFCTDSGMLDEQELRMLEELSGDLGFAIESMQKQQAIDKLETEKEDNFEETILSFIRLVEERDSYTAGHSVRVAYYSALIGMSMNLAQTELQKLEKAAILHDLGKIATPDAILLRPGRLNAIEYDLIKLHVTSSYDILSRINIYKDLAEIIRYHHERHDGKGYPSGISGDEIPMLSRILSIADAFDAMTTDRVYHSRLSREEALKEIEVCSGSQFSPEEARAALLALADAQIPDVRSRLPMSELEKKRFSYFFNDRLTDLYNEDYLFVLLQNPEKVREYSNICFISIRNFSQFNKKAGWEHGDEILKKFSHQLQTEFPDSLIFRVQGDDFIVITKTNRENCERISSKVDFMRAHDLSISLHFQALASDQPLELNKRILNEIFDS